jgi:WD40 repeat protein
MATAKLAQLTVLIVGVALTIVCGLAATMPDRPPIQPGVDVVKAVAQPGDREAQGDPLPAGAVARLGTARFRHAGEVTTVVYFPDGKTVASGGMDDTIRLWDTATGKELRRFEGTHVALAPDGKKWATWSTNIAEAKNPKLRLWDVSTGRQLHEFVRPGRFTAVFSPDSKILALGGAAAKNLNQLYLFDVDSGKELPAPQMGESFDDVCRLAFTTDGKTLLTSGDDDSRVRFWNLQSGQESLLGGTGQKLPPPGAYGQALACSPDGKTLAVGDWDKPGQRDPKPIVRLFDLETRGEVLRFDGFRVGVGALTFSRDGKFLVGGDGAGLIRWWNAATGKELGTVTHHQGRVNSLAFSPDGKTVVSGGRDHSVQLWDLATGKALHKSTGHQGEVTSVAFAPDSRTIISASSDKTIRLWDLATGKETRRLGAEAPIWSIALAGDGKLLASGSRGASESDASVSLWDVTTGHERFRFQDKHGGRVVALSPDGRTLAVPAFRSVALLDAATGRLNCVAAVPKDKPFGDIRFIAFSLDGKRFAWVSYDHCRLSETATGNELDRFTFFRSPDSLASVDWGTFSPDGRTLLLRVEGAYVVWDIDTSKELRRFGLTNSRGHSAALSPDGKTLAAGYLDGTIRLWDVVTGKARQQFQGHEGWVTSQAWSVDGKLLVSGGADTTVLAWNVGAR